MGSLTSERSKSPNSNTQIERQAKMLNVTWKAVTWSNMRTKTGELRNLTSVAEKSSKVTSKIREKKTFTTKTWKLSNITLNSDKLSNSETKDGMYFNATNFKALSNVSSKPGELSNFMKMIAILSPIKSQYDKFYLNSSICDVMSTTRYIITDKDESVGMLEYLLQEQVTCRVKFTVHIFSPAYSILNLEFTYFRTRHCTDKCLCDSLTMYDVVNDTMEVRDSFCGVCFIKIQSGHITTDFHECF